MQHPHLWPSSQTVRPFHGGHGSTFEHQLGSCSTPAPLRERVQAMQGPA